MVGSVSGALSGAIFKRSAQSVGIYIKHRLGNCRSTIEPGSIVVLSFPS